VHGVAILLLELKVCFSGGVFEKELFDVACKSVLDEHCEGYET
jgi:hypothetical protein